MDGLVDWLNTHWAGPVPLTEIYAGDYFHEFSVILGECMGLIVANPNSIGDGYPAYVAVYLAAWVPEFDPSRLTVVRSEIERLGFRLVIEIGGLRALAHAPTVRHLIDTGQETVLPRVASMLVEAASIVGARPIELPPV